MALPHPFSCTPHNDIFHTPVLDTRAIRVEDDAIITRPELSKGQRGGWRWSQFTIGSGNLS